jgi:hypothetical protein
MLLETNLQQALSNFLPENPKKQTSSLLLTPLFVLFFFTLCRRSPNCTRAARRKEPTSQCQQEVAAISKNRKINISPKTINPVNRKKKKKNQQTTRKISKQYKNKQTIPLLCLLQQQQKKKKFAIQKEKSYRRKAHL